MPSSIYIAKEEKTTPGPKASKERFTSFLRSNAVGNYKLKPLLVYKTENPRALMGIWKGQLPVIWKLNKKASITLMLKDLSLQVMLVLNNAPHHPAHLDDFHPNVKVVGLPPNTTALLPLH